MVREVWDIEGFESWASLGQPVRVIRSLERRTVTRQRTGKTETQTSEWMWATTLPKDRVGTRAAVRPGALPLADREPGPGRDGYLLARGPRIPPPPYGHHLVLAHLHAFPEPLSGLLSPQPQARPADRTYAASFRLPDLCRALRRQGRKTAIETPAPAIPPFLSAIAGRPITRLQTPVCLPRTCRYHPIGSSPQLHSSSSVCISRVLGSRCGIAARTPKCLN